MPCRTVTLQDLVVQHRACLVQCHDGVVGKLLLPLPAGANESLVNVVLTAPLCKAVRCGGMTAKGDSIGFSETLDFVRGLASTGVVEPAQ